MVALYTCTKATAYLQVDVADGPWSGRCPLLLPEIGVSCLRRRTPPSGGRDRVDRGGASLLLMESDQLDLIPVGETHHRHDNILLLIVTTCRAMPLNVLITS